MFRIFGMQHRSFIHYGSFDNVQSTCEWLQTNKLTPQEWSELGFRVRMPNGEVWMADAFLAGAKVGWFQ